MEGKEVKLLFQFKWNSQVSLNIKKSLIFSHFDFLGKILEPILFIHEFEL